MKKYAPHVLDLASRDVVSRAMATEVREGRGVGPKKDHIYLKLDHLGKDLIMERLPGIWELAYKFVGVDCTKEPIPVEPTGHYHMGGIPTNVKSEVVVWDGEKDVPVPGFYAAGECSCQSLHGANRLGTNSLIDLVVSGKQAGMNAAKYIIEEGAPAPLPAEDFWAEKFGKETLEKIKELFDGPAGNVKYQDIFYPLRDSMQENMSVFRTEEGLKKELKILDDLEGKFKEMGLADKSLHFNSELVEYFELRSLLAISRVETEAALNRTESRGGHFREDYPERDDKNWLKHTLVYMDKDGKVRFDYKPVRMKPITAPTFPPKKRVY